MVKVVHVILPASVNPIPCVSVGYAVIEIIHVSRRCMQVGCIGIFAAGILVPGVIGLIFLIYNPLFKNFYPVSDF